MITSPLNRRLYAERCLSHLNLGWYILHVEITRGGGEELSDDYRSAIIAEWRAESAAIEERVEELEEGSEGKSRDRRADEAPRLLDFQALLRVCARLQEQGFDFDAPEGSREYDELASEFDHAAPGTPTVSLREFLRWSESEQGMCSTCADPCTCAIAMDSDGALSTLVHADDHFGECSSTYEGVPGIVSKHFLPWDAPRQRPPPDPYAHGLAHLALDLGWSEPEAMVLLRKGRPFRDAMAEEDRYSPSLLGCNEYDDYGEILQPRIDPRTPPRTFCPPITFTLLFSDLDDENNHRYDPCNSNTYALHLWAQETITFPNPKNSKLWHSKLLDGTMDYATPARGISSFNDGLGQMLDYMQLWFEQSRSLRTTWQSAPTRAEALPWSNVEYILRQAFYRGGLGGHTVSMQGKGDLDWAYGKELGGGGCRSFAEVLRERVLPYDSKRLWTSAIAEYAAAKLRVFHPDALVTWTSFCWFAEAREWQAPPVNPENLARAIRVVRHCRAQRRLPYLLLRSRLSGVDNIGDAADGGGDVVGGTSATLASSLLAVPSSTITPLADLKAQISKIVASGSLDNLTMKIVRKRLSTHYAVDMEPHKKLIKELLTEVLTQEAEAEADTAEARAAAVEAAGKDWCEEARAGAVRYAQYRRNAEEVAAKLSKSRVYLRRRDNAVVLVRAGGDWVRVVADADDNDESNTEAEAIHVQAAEVEAVTAREAADAAAEAHQAALDELNALQPAYDAAVYKVTEARKAAVITAKAAHAAEDAAKALAGGVCGGGSGGDGGACGGGGDYMDDCGGGLSALLQWLFATSPDFAFQSVLRFIEA